MEQEKKTAVMLKATAEEFAKLQDIMKAKNRNTLSDTLRCLIIEEHQKILTFDTATAVTDR